MYKNILGDVLLGANVLFVRMQSPRKRGQEYRPHSPCGHLAFTGTQITRTAAKSPAK